MAQADTDSGRIVLLMAASHAAAGAAAVFAFGALQSLILPPWATALLGVTLAALLGLVLTVRLRRAVELATLALVRLNGGLPVAALPQAGGGPLPELLRAVDNLAARSRELDAVRGQVLRQAQETAAQQERNRLARDLHDSIKQQLFSISASAAAAQARWESDPAGARAALADARQAAQEAMAEMRALLDQLRPLPLESVGLVQALREQCEALGYRSGARVTCELAELPEAGRLPPGTAEALFRIAQEALSNIARHARAQNVDVRLGLAGAGQAGAIVLEIRDDGQGFPAETPPGMGLANMRERARELGSSLDLRTEPGRGTCVTVRVPQLAPALTQEEGEMNAAIERYVHQGKRAQMVAALSGGLALLVGLTAIPYVAKLLPVGGLSGLNLFLGLGVRGIVALAGLGAAALALGRVRRAETGLALAGESAEPALLRLRAEQHGQMMWFSLVAALIVPGALLRPYDPQFPLAALALGMLLIALGLYHLWRSRAATERYWTALPAGSQQVEVEREWSQRYVPVLVGAITVPAYLFLLFNGNPAGALIGLPLGREAVYNLLTTLYLLALIAWGVVYWRQAQRWHMRLPR